MWLLVALSVFAAWLYRELWGKRAGLPPGPMPLPLLGNLFSLDQNNLEESIAELAKRYGDTFTVWVGRRPQVMVTKASTLRQVFARAKTADAVAGRPLIYTFEAWHEAPNAGLTFSSGPKWRETRRFAVRVLRDFGMGRSRLEASIRQEGHAMNQYFAELLGGAKRGNLDPTDALAVCVINVISRIVYGHPYERGDRRLVQIQQLMEGAIREFSSTAGLLLATTPALRHVPLFAHFGADAFTAFARSFYAFIDQEIEDIEKEMDYEAEAGCFVEAYLQEMRTRSKAGDLGHLSRFQLSRTVGDIWSAGFETTVTTLRWAVVHLALHPEAQAEVHRELDAFYPDPSAEVSFDHRAQLPYTAAAIQEVQRLANVTTVGLQRETTAAVEVDGWRLPAGTLIVANTGAALKDPRDFHQPHSFRPERFLDEQGKAKKVDSFMPFSVGRRACAGESLARTELFVLLAQLLRRFRFGPSPSHDPPSLTPKDGQQIRKPKDFTVTVEDRAA